jgi:hypothetical protein
MRSFAPADPLVVLGVGQLALQEIERVRQELLHGLAGSHRAAVADRFESPPVSRGRIAG